MSLKNISDTNLVRETKSLVKEEREILVKILSHLREIERRKLYSDYKCSSLFAFCIEVLGYSESQAQRRILAMRLVRDNPEVETKIAEGSLSLTNAANAQSLFQKNKSSPKKEILKKLESKSSREAELVLNEYFPNAREKLREGVRELGDEIEIRMVLKKEDLELLEQVRGMLVHKEGALTNAELFRALLKEKTAKIKHEPKRRLNARLLAAPTVKPRFIPAQLKREIKREANHECTNCGSRFALELDHCKPIAWDGTSEKENLRLLCRNCNQRAAIQAGFIGEFRDFRLIT